MRILTLNCNVTEDDSVNVFQFLETAASDLLLATLTEEDFDGAQILDRRYHKDARKSPLYQWQDMEFIWTDDDFSVEAYTSTRKHQVIESLMANEPLRLRLIETAKIDSVALKHNVSVESMLFRAVEKLVYFDAHVADALRRTMTYEDFCALHQSAQNVVDTTLNSVCEELKRDPENTVFMLQEVNHNFLQLLEARKPFSHQLLRNHEGSAAILFPYPGSVQQLHDFPTDGNTFLHEDTCVLRCNDVVYISSHFSSKTRQEAAKQGKNIQKNMEDQLDVMNAYVQTLLAQNTQVVLAADFNHRVSPTSVHTHKIYPLDPSVATNAKKRSALQCQFRKINKLDMKSKDAICVYSDAINVKDCRVRSLYKDRKAYCSYAMDTQAANADTDLVYPVRVQYPQYEFHYPDHDLVEIVF